MNRVLYLIAGFVLTTCLCGYTNRAYADPPIDGQAVVLQPNHFWKIQPLTAVQLKNSQIITHNLHFPSISPDGSKILFFESGEPGQPHTIYMWSAKTNTMNEIQKSRDLSNYISWQDDQTYTIHDHDKPFFKDGTRQIYELSPKSTNISPKLKSRSLITNQSIRVYDAGDIIILENDHNHTLQAISDPKRDRYYAPMLSPDNKYVVFNGLTTGIHIFDIQSNQVVYIGASGTSPSFSPDGRYLIYAQTTDNGHQLLSGELVLIDLRQHTSRLITNPNHEIRLHASLSNLAADIVYETNNGKIYKATLDLK